MLVSAKGHPKTSICQWRMCQSEPRGMPGLEQDAGAMPNDENDPEGVNLGQKRNNSAWEGVIRPGLGNPGLARPEQCPKGSLGETIPARSDPPDLAQPGAEERSACRQKWPSGAEELWPSREKGRRPNPAGLRRSWASRGRPAQPGNRAGSPAGERSWGPNQNWPAGPAREEESQPSRMELGRWPRKRTSAQPECKYVGPAGKGCHASPGCLISALEGLFRPGLL
jgi:hypothetical protein